MTRWLLVLITLALSLQTAHATSRDITLEETITVKRVTQAVTNDDGTLTAFVRVRPRTPYKDDDGTAYSELFVVNNEGRVTPFVTGDVRIGQIQFAADDSAIFYLSQRGDDKHTSLYKLPIGGGESTRIYQHKVAISSFSVSGDGNTIAFLAREPQPEKTEELARKGFRAQVYEEQTRKAQLWTLDLSTEAPEASLVEIDEHIHSLAFRPGHNQVLLRVAPTTLVDDDLMLSQYAVFDLEGNEVARMQSVGKLGQAAFSPNGAKFAFIGGEDQHDPKEGRLYVGNLDDGSVRELVPGFPGHIVDLAWQDNDHVIWLADVNVETDLRRTNVNNGQTNVVVAEGKAIFTRLNHVRSNGDLTLIGHHASHPTEVFRVIGGELTRLTDSNPWLADIRQPRQEVIVHEARDGLRLEGILVYPHNYQPGTPVPVIMSIHGGPEAHVRNGWNNSYSNPIWYAAQQGFATFFPNYRGSTGRGVNFSKLGQNDYAGKEFDDIVDAKEHLVAIGLADPERVGITGGSYGGYASAWGATKQTEHFAASVMFVGISNNLSKFGTTDIPNEMHLVHARSYPWDKWQWYLERSPIYWAEQARTPILIMHGAEDTRVHPSQSMELYRYLKVHGNVPVRLVLYPGEGHGNQRVGSQLDYALRLMRWMNFYLVEQGEGIPPHELPHAEHLD
ncbi:S9 family peptidase [Aliidiomarina halalkaliphila]|uniref:S9 family peptidase n=1 Tax=Aliidiomarina halalkaliphila TaxID=2593535 RepID=A0A552X2B4_9GAMM|nr:S9 family peptidase [Aliidiomarina halalkaliphila]TRW49019.1 S9 family peptidase [Aliidiomarina halalkaliphila]